MSLAHPLAEFITEAADRLDHLPALAELSPKRRDVYVDGPVEHRAAIAQGRFDDLVARDDSPGPRGEKLEYTELGGGERDRLLAKFHLPPAPVHDQVPASNEPLFFLG